MSLPEELRKPLEDIKNPILRYLVIGMTLIIVVQWTVMGILAQKNNNLYEDKATMERQCWTNWMAANEASRIRAEQAKAIADSIHNADQKQLRELMSDRITAVSKQDRKIKKELK